MAALILGVLMLGIAVLLIVAHVRVRAQTAERAADRVRRSLAGRRDANGRAEVLRWGARPLSENMIKDIAESDGYSFAGASSSGSGLTRLQFVAPSSGKLTIDD